MRRRKEKQNRSTRQGSKEQPMRKCYGGTGEKNPNARCQKVRRPRHHRIYDQSRAVRENFLKKAMNEGGVESGIK